MKRLCLLGAAVLVLVAAAARSRVQLQAPPAVDLRAEAAERNPWTNLRLNNDPADFRFAFVSDRTGGHRARVFSQAVEQLNLLQPEFVVCVGDLIEGYSDDSGLVAGQWKEFQTYVSRLQMPFFYLPGNHDLANRFQEKLWQEKFGRRYYHFVYRGVLFLLLSSEDPPGDRGHIGEEQLAYIKQALEQNKDARWTLVALHRPLWSQDNVAENGWLEVEKLLNGRPYTVFAGHVHRYQKYVRNGRNYYQLATTGGGSRLRGVPYGEFDHITWVTMKKDGPLLANILLDGIYPENMRRPVSDEAGVVDNNRRPVHPVRGQVLADGCPVVGAQVAFFAYNPQTNKPAARVGDALAEPDGTFLLSTYGAFDGAPAGEYVVTVAPRDPLHGDPGRSPPTPLPAKYARPDTSPLRVRVVPGKNDFTLELK
jgi:3',5'-cyclic AMP phosphodiesterase CpdA